LAAANTGQRVLKERGIDKMLKEVRDDNKENDAEHMKPVSPFELEHLLRIASDKLFSIDDSHSLSNLCAHSQLYQKHILGSHY
jgi:hypothetical protein